MATDDCNADGQANDLFTSLTADAPTPPTIDFTDPKFSFTIDESSNTYADIIPLTLADLTEVDLEGEGAFDQLMSSVDLHIEREFKDSRITGDQYAKVYTEVTVAVLNTATQFLLQKDQARWNAITAQMEARIAEIRATEALISLEKTKAETAKMVFDMKNSGAQYALTKMEIANADAQYCLTKSKTRESEYNVDKLLPVELAIQNYQRMQVLPSTVAINKVQSNRLLPAEAAIKEYTHRQVVPAQAELIKEQIESQRAQTLDTRSDGVTPISGLLGKQKDSIVQDIASKQFNVDQVLPVQLDLVKEQREAERAKTMNTRSDGSTIVLGSVGKQKDLYTQQIDSFIKDSKHKAAKMWFDGWITQKTLDEGITPPTQLNETNINEVLTSLRIENDLGIDPYEPIQS